MTIDFQQAQALVVVRLSYSAVAQRATAESEEAVAEQVYGQLGKVVSDGHGRVVEASTNELVASFDDAHNGLTTTRVIQQAAATELAQHGVKVRIGLVQTLNGFSEESWQLALAKGRELARLATSSQTLACVPSAPELRTTIRQDLTEIDPQEWHDELCKDHEKVYSVLWQDDVPTRMVLTAGEVKPITRIGKLRLTWRDVQFELTEDSQSVSVGRGANADITIDSTFASRDHAHVEYVDACFVLTDHSTNGTYVQIDGSEVFVHDDKVILRGEGWISLGRRPPSSKGLVIYFWAYTDSASNSIKIT